MKNIEIQPISELDSLIPLSIARDPEFATTITFAQSVERRRERLLNRLHRGFNEKNSHRQIPCIDILNDLTIELKTLTGTMKAVHIFRRNRKHSPKT